MRLAPTIALCFLALAPMGCKQSPIPASAEASGSPSNPSAVVPAKAAAANPLSTKPSGSADAVLAHQLFARAREVVTELEETLKSHPATSPESVALMCKYMGLIRQAAALGDSEAQQKYAQFLATLPSSDLRAACVEVTPATLAQAKNYIAQLRMDEKCKISTPCQTLLDGWSDDIALKAAGANDPETLRKTLGVDQSQRQVKVTVLQVRREYVTTSSWTPVAMLRNNGDRDVKFSLPYRAVRSDGVIVDQGKFFGTIPAHSTVEEQGMGAMLTQEAEIKLGELQIHD